MVSLYYISIHPLKINEVFGVKTFFSFIRNLALLSSLFFRTENSSNAKMSVLSVWIFIRLNASFLVIIRKQGS
jgi:hypothetical protein